MSVYGLGGESQLEAPARRARALTPRLTGIVKDHRIDIVVELIHLRRFPRDRVLGRLDAEVDELGGEIVHDVGQRFLQMGIEGCLESFPVVQTWVRSEEPVVEGDRAWNPLDVVAWW